MRCSRERGSRINNDSSNESGSRSGGMAQKDLESFLAVRQTIASFLQEDTGTGDITSELVLGPENLEAEAEIVCKSDAEATVSGLEEAGIAFDICNCTCQALVKDGSKVRKGRVAVMRVVGRARDILRAERTALNLIMRMSGIATETRRLADAAEAAVNGGKKKRRSNKGREGKIPIILATRKTAPGLRYFDKKAVVAGGGQAHRMRLDDMVLIKDNHIALAGPARRCIERARKGAGSSIRIECEVRSKKEAVEAILAGADIIMLDNFTPAQAKDAISEVEKMGLRGRAKIEISGGVNHQNIGRYARAGADFISLGYITHSPRAVDFSLEIIPPARA